MMFSESPAIAGGVPIRPPDRPVIFGAPSLGQAEIDAVTECLRSGWIGPGKRVEEFEREFARYKGSRTAIAVSSGTAAIQLALFGIGIRPGDEVIAPSMTFAPSLHAIVHAGATPVLVDCRRDTFTIDPGAIEKHITSRTKAILVVHLCGRCSDDMEQIVAIARRQGVRIIEDCAHAIEAAGPDGRAAGLIGDVGCFSFYATKNLTTGDGGMVISRHDRIARRMRLVSQQGVTAGVWRRFLSGDNAYQLIALGYRCAMNDIAASLGLVQLAGIEHRWRRRQQIWHDYDRALRGLPLALPQPPSCGSRHAYHLYTPLLLEEQAGITRTALIEAMRAENIGTGVHYIPAHRQPYYRRKFRLRAADFANATFAGDRTISLPLSPELTEEDIAHVCTALTRILQYHSDRSRNAQLPVRTGARVSAAASSCSTVEQRS